MIFYEWYFCIKYHFFNIHTLLWNFISMQYDNTVTLLKTILYGYSILPIENMYASFVAFFWDLIAFLVENNLVSHGCKTRAVRLAHLSNQLQTTISGTLSTVQKMQTLNHAELFCTFHINFQTNRDCTKALNQTKCERVFHNRSLVPVFASNITFK